MNIRHFLDRSVGSVSDRFKSLAFGKYNRRDDKGKIFVSCSNNTEHLTFSTWLREKQFIIPKFK